MPKRSKSTPTNAPDAKTVSVMRRLARKFLLTRKRTSRPTPELAMSPAIIAPVLITPPRKSSVITTEEAQLGIRPTSAATKGAKIPVFAANTASCSSPIK